MPFDPSASSESFYDVYTGIWTNWDRGAVFGVKLTLRRSEGTLLIAFVALFVTIVGTRAWRVACFALHQVLSSEGAHDGLYHQRQATLRNSSNAASDLISLIQISWVWRSISSKRSRAIIPIAFAVLFTTAFAVASGFSSRVATGNQVLISSPRCGFVNSPSGFKNFTLYQLTSMPFNTKMMKHAANYAQQCYASNASGELGCNTFIKKRLGTSAFTNASCPFSGGICRSNNTNLLLDTGYLDSHDDFGLNSPPEERFQYRKLLHCSPLVTEGYKSVWNLSNERSYTRYHYGRFASANFTYEYTNDPAWGPNEHELFTANADYDIGTRFAWYTNGSIVSNASGFSPIPHIQRTDADVLLLFLSAGRVLFNTRTHDDWYSATRKAARVHLALASGNGSRAGAIDLFSQDEPASPLACINQEQYCNPRLPEDSRCGPLHGWLESYNNIPILFKEDAMRDRIKWFSFGSLPVDNVLSDLGSQSLTSRDSLSNGIQGPLSNNQWQLDAQHWFETTMAYMQASLVLIATGPSDPALQEWVWKPNTTGLRSMCQNQKIISTAHISFSVFGLLFVCCLGSLIILVSFILEPVLGSLQKRYRRNEYQRLEWCTNETLQLQRLAHEELGLGTWSRATDTVPVTERNECLAVLDLQDREHPRLKAWADDTNDQVELQTTSDQETEGFQPGLPVNMPHGETTGSGTLRDDGSILETRGGSHDSPVPCGKPAKARTF